MKHSKLTSTQSLAALGMLMLLAVAPAVQASAGQRGDIVGEVTTVIGQGRVVSSEGEESLVARGQHIRAGDRIETALGGHVHVRFVDGGLVSVRPQSRLLIESYANAEGRGLAAIKFKLEQGVIRSVTGQWGEANRDRFRLNTPIAAIGVKGTDFVVKVDRGNTFASVISGAIVMAPLADCAAALGPCQTPQAATLSAEMQGKMLEYLQQNGAGAPRLVPAIDLLAREGAAAVGAELRRADAGSETSGKLRSGETLGGHAIDTGSARPRTQSLAWFHNALGWNVAENTISERYDAARIAGRTLVASNFFIGLYRDESVLKTFQPIGSQASFQLTEASATFTMPLAYGRPVENVAISQASLTADFGQRSFSTQMTLQSPGMGRDQFVATGSINEHGLMLAGTPGQTLSGAFSTDGMQAGYSFDKQVANGTVSGLTLWGR